jgi:hypothetical protein
MRLTDGVDSNVVLLICLTNRVNRLVAGFPLWRPGFEPGSGHVGFCGGQSGAGAGFLRVLRFPLPIFIPPIAPQSSSSIIRDWSNRPEVAAVLRDLVPPHKIKKNRVNDVLIINAAYQTNYADKCITLTNSATKLLRQCSFLWLQSFWGTYSLVDISTESIWSCGYILC